MSTFSFVNALLNDGLLAQYITPNLEDQVIYDRDFLPLAFDKSMSSCKAADATLVRPGYFISPVLANIWCAFPYSPPGQAPYERVATLIVVGRRRLISGHRMVGGKQEDSNIHARIK